MRFFLGNNRGRNRRIIWLLAGGSTALLLAIVTFGASPALVGWSWRRANEAVSGRLASDPASATTDTSGVPKKVNSAGSNELAVVARKTAGRKAAPSDSVRASRGAGTRGDADATDDADLALFTALERLERQMAAAIGLARESVVALEYTSPDAPVGTRRVATGVVINKRGEVVSVRIDQPAATTARAAVTGTSPIVARDFSGRCHSVHWVAADPETGLTLLRLPARAVPPIRTAAGGPGLGSQVFIVGNPFGMGHSVSRGHVAGLDRALELGTRQLGGLIQVQAPLYPGDSGAAVVNLKGDWLGLIRSGLAIPGPGSASGSDGVATTPVPGPLATPGLSPSLAPTDISLGRPERDTDFGFAIPVQDALWVADQLRTQGRVDRAYLGVRLEPMPATATRVTSKTEAPPGSTAIFPARRSETEAGTHPWISANPEGTAAAIADDGAILREVLAGTPAAQAGLLAGDGIVELDGQPIRSAHDLTDRLDRILSNTKILLGVVRNRGQHRERISLSLRTASRPDAPQAAAIGVPTTAIASATAPASVSALPPATGGTQAAPTIGPEVPSRVDAPLPAVPRPDELQLNLPRAIVDRLDKLERRLNKLESFPGQPTGAASAPDRQVSSARNP